MPADSVGSGSVLPSRLHGGCLDSLCKSVGVERKRKAGYNKLDPMLGRCTLLARWRQIAGVQSNTGVTSFTARDTL